MRKSQINDLDTDTQESHSSVFMPLQLFNPNEDEVGQKKLAIFCSKMLKKLCSKS
jgi:hypothetical protein